MGAQFLLGGRVRKWLPLLLMLAKTLHCALNHPLSNQEPVDIAFNAAFSSAI